MAYILRQHQEDIIEQAMAAITFGEKKLMLDCPPAYGKEQPYSEPVLTSNGWKTMGDLTLNDNVIGSDGLSKSITHIHEQGTKDVYEVTFLDGSSTRCGIDHLWTYRERQDPYRTGSLSEIMNKKSALKEKKIKIKLPAPVEFYQDNTLPLDPYAFGVLLGDGSFRNNQVSLSNNNEEIRNKIIKALPAGDFVSRECTRNEGRKHDIFFSRKGKCKTNLASILESFGLLNHKSVEKFIPDIYMYSSIENRKQLLQGLLDTDGHLVNCKNKYYEYSTSSEKLANNIINLARSLGLYVSSSSRIPTYSHKGEKKEGLLNYRVYINFDRKEKSIVSITKLDYQENSRCITIDSSDSLYITKDYTLTHNSLVMAEVAKQNEHDGVILMINITALLEQIAAHLDEQGVTYSILKADYTNHFDPDCKVQLIMAQTLHARIGKIKFNHKFKIMQIDEGHIAHPDVSKRTADCIDFIKPEVQILYSGTPYTAEGYAFSGYEYLSNLGTQELQDAGFLCPIKYFVPRWAEEIDFSDIKTTTNEYNTVELDKIINTTSHLNLALCSMNEMNAKSKKTIVFCSSIEQADHFETILRKDGYNARAYHSKTSKKHGQLILDAFINNTKYIEPEDKETNLLNFQDENPNKGEDVTCLLSIGKLSVGFDCPDVSLGVQLRPVKSRSYYIQQVMRLARKHPSKEYAEYLDLGQTLSMHSFHTDHFEPVQKDLANPEKSKKLLEDRKKILGLEDLSVIIDEESPVEITREFYDVKMQELKSKLENAEKESLTIQDLIKSFKMAKEAITIIIVGSQLMTKAYGDPVSKQGRPYKYDPFWIYEEWEKAFAKYPEKIHQWTKALKTRTGNIIREEKNFNSLRFFIDFLVKKHLEESVSIIDEYRKPDNHINNLRSSLPEIDIYIDNIPF